MTVSDCPPVGSHIPFSGRLYMLTQSVFGPLDFRLVIQIILSQCMNLNACVHTRYICLTSVAEDVALPQEWYTHIHTAHVRAGD